MAKPTIFLQGYVDKVGSANSPKLEVTLKIIESPQPGMYKTTTKTYLLPDKKSEFTKLTEDLYNSGKQKPTYVPKKTFQREFIDYTLSLNPATADVDAATNNYNDNFKLAVEEVLVGLQENETAAVKSFVGSMMAVIDSDAKNIYDEVKAPSILESPYPGPPIVIDPDPVDDSSEGYPEPVPANHPGAISSTSKPSNKHDRSVKAGSNNLSDSDAGNLGSLPADIAANLLGIGGDKLPEAVPKYNAKPGDVVVENENNAGLIVGRDEHYGLRGHTQSGACYLFAGRSTTNIKTETKNPDSPNGKSQLLKNNDLVRDSAYIYVSQKADPDELLKVAGGTYASVVRGPAPRAGKSLVALKADDVVIMARESGIRLVTGMDVNNSRGGELTAKFGIDIIAGNNDRDLQPMVLGNNLVVYLKGLSKSVSEVRSVLYSFLTSQISFNSKIMAHQHYDPFLVFLGLLAYGNPLAVMGGKNFISPGVFQSGVKALLEGLQQQFSAIAMEQNRSSNDSRGLDPMGINKILSEKNRVN